MIRLSAIVLIPLLLTTGCKTHNTKSEAQLFELSNPLIMEILPEQIDDFHYMGTHYYPEPWGYSLRYQYKHSYSIYSDIYIYPTPEAIKGDPHKDVVTRMSLQAIREIEHAQEKGMYSEFEIISSASYEQGSSIVSRADIYLVKDNMESYSLIYLTEYKGKIIKARFVMPDSDSNRNQEAWQSFVQTIFSTIKQNIDIT